MDTFYGSSKCVYTAQGEVLCKTSTGATREHFIEEMPNDVENVFGGRVLKEENLQVLHAIANKYCEIATTTDPATGKTVNTFKKTCNK